MEQQTQTIIMIALAFIFILCISGGIFLFYTSSTSETTTTTANGTSNPKAAWTSCAVATDCDTKKGYYCRIGDKRCLNDAECDWANWKDQTKRDCTKMT